MSKKKKWILTGAIIAVILIAGGIYAHFALRDAETLKKEELNKLPSTVLVGYLESEDRCVKMAEVNPIPGYKDKLKYKLDSNGKRIKDADGKAIPEADPDGYPDLVVIEFAVNDWAEPTGGRCYESMVKETLEQPNEPAVILLFAARKDGWNLQNDLRKIGDRYNLPMVSIVDGIWQHLDKDFPIADFYTDDYHPNSTGHQMMADALMQAVADAAAAETAENDVDLNAEPVYGTDFMGLKTIFGDSTPEGVEVDRGGFTGNDTKAYRNKPVGQVCGKNFFHSGRMSADPLKVTGVFRKCLVSWLASGDSTYGAAEILVDGEVKITLEGGAGKWGQSEVVLVLDEAEAAEHTVEIRPKDEKKWFTITAISVQ